MRPACLFVLLFSCLSRCPFAAAQSSAVGVASVVQKTTLAGVPLSNGSSIYSGDTLTTGTGGFARIQAGKVQFALPQDSSVRFSRFAGRLIAELRAGTLVYSATGEFQPFSIYANDMQFVPGGPGFAIGQIKAPSGCEILAYVRRGQLAVSLGEDSRILHEGETYPHFPPVGINYTPSPTANQPGLPPALSADPEFLSPHSHVACPPDLPNPAGKPPGVEKTVAAGIAAVTGIALYLALESPDSPCPASASCHTPKK